jgi:hypothetical protein
MDKKSPDKNTYLICIFVARPQYNIIYFNYIYLQHIYLDDRR